MELFGHANRVLNRFGYQIEAKGLQYFDPLRVVEEARSRRLSLCEYLERFNVGGVGRRRDAIVSALTQYIPKQLDTVLEIGAGTGMFLEKIIELYSPRKYEVYETALGWVKYLRTQYSNRVDLRCHNADGITLHNTKAESVDAVFAHGVFVYLPLIVTFGYLEEAVRVLTRTGVLVFDCFIAERFGIDTIRQWQNDPYKYKFPTTISQSLIGELAARSELTIAGTFDVKYHASNSTYFVLRKAPLS
jgi:phospholipid N-methyltransferase